MRMNTTKFHTVFKDRQIVADLINERFYNNNTILIPSMIRPYDPEVYQTFYNSLELDQKTCIVHCVDLNENTYLLIMIKNTFFGIRTSIMKITAYYPKDEDESFNSRRIQ